MVPCSCYSDYLKKKLWNSSQGQNNTVIFNVPWRTQAPPPHHLSLPHKLLYIDVFVLNKNSDTKWNRVKASLEGSCADYLFTINVISYWCCPQRSCRTLANVNHPPHLRPVYWQVCIIYPKWQLSLTHLNYLWESDDAEIKQNWTGTGKNRNQNNRLKWSGKLFLNGLYTTCLRVSVSTYGLWFCSLNTTSS